MEDAKTRSFECSEIRITKELQQSAKKKKKELKSRAAPAGKHDGARRLTRRARELKNQAAPAERHDGARRRIGTCYLSLFLLSFHIF